MTNPQIPAPLISVIIPTYNYAKYLPRAIKSILLQSYSNIEIIVIDDGSVDETSLVIRQYPFVRYFYQENSGLSSARNSGIDKSMGQYLVFLDADDWLEKDALKLQLEFLQRKPSFAFVSGNYFLLRDGDPAPDMVQTMLHADPYIMLLQMNYIGMHAAVMFQRWVFDTIRYDETLKAYEDYDLYLSVARRYPVTHQQQFIATYYIHNSGMSRNFPLMINALKTIFVKHAAFIRTENEWEAYMTGVDQWKAYVYNVKTAV